MSEPENVNAEASVVEAQDDSALVAEDAEATSSSVEATPPTVKSSDAKADATTMTTIAAPAKEKEVDEKSSDDSVVNDAPVVPSNESADDEDEDFDVPPPPIDDDEDGDDDDTDAADDNIMSQLPPYIAQRVERLKDLDAQRDDIMETYLAERAALEQKFAALCQPLYVERAAVARGEKDVEIDATAQPADGHENEEARLNGADGPRLPGIPQFWACCMTQHDDVGEIVTDEDVDCLEHLQDITCTDDEDGKGFTLRFHFAPNEYFHDTVLTKRYDVPNLLLSNEPILQNVSGCKIQWKPNRCLTHRKVQKKQRGKGRNKGQIRTVTKVEDKESFFRWFEPPALPNMEDMDEEEADHLEETFDGDYEIAQAFRQEIIPKAVLWFTGEAAEQEMLSAMQAMEDQEGHVDADEQ